VHEHSYPHCWRCGTPLLYYALPSWYIKTTAVKNDLLAQNERTSWYPPSIRDGRYGEWLRNNVDWSLSRSRYWGTPLPLWICADEHVTCVGSLAELSEYAGRDLSGLDPHRPFVDSVTLRCPSCGALAQRVPEVIDVWYDSGSMPFAQYGAAARPADYPAQFICEGIDQTRGWFYSLMAVGTMVFGESSYENVLCLGTIVDESGRKMSKHIGNVLAPLPLMEQHGADALRWFFAGTGSPWATRRLSVDALGEIVRKVILTYWNTTSFLALYASDWTPGSFAVPGSLLDRWVLSSLHALVRDVTTALDSFDAAGAARRLAAFIDDLSNWYVRRARRRFWAADPAAFGTLHECLRVLTLLMAPFMPFLTDYLWEVLTGPSSVHLAAWPSFDESLISAELEEQMALVRRIVELGRSARAGAGVRTRQPLGRALIGAAGFASLPGELHALIAEELNVLSVEDMGGESLVDYSVKPSYRSLGKRFGAATPSVAAEVLAAPAAALAAAVLAGDTFDVGSVTVGADDVIITQTPRAGWAVASAAGETVALDVSVTDELRRAGLAREVIRLIQDARKTSGLDVGDRISLHWSATDPELASVLELHGQEIAAEVLATDFGPARPADPADPGDAGDAGDFGDDELGFRFTLRRVPS
jgi:isoleucyl-tRNA synthetase